MPTYTPGKLVLKKESVPFDNDAWEYIARVETADGQILEQSVRNAITNFVIGCKADGIWTAIKASCILAGARTLAGALVPLVGAAPTNAGGLFVSGDYDRKTGLVGDGSTKYLNSNRNNNADPQNSKHVSIFISTASTIYNYGRIVAAGDASAGDTTIVMNLSSGSGGHVVSINNIANDDKGNQNNTGFLGLNRNTAANFVFRFNSGNTQSNFTSTTPRNENISLYGRPGEVISRYVNTRLAFYSIGESLDLALLDTRVTALINAFAAAIP
jgi:hypothetical protein